MNSFNNLYLLSDLHIDHWSSQYKTKYPHGEITESPLILSERYDDVLIIAGDVCDDLDLTINYLNSISDNFKKILFVEGNHEHVYKYPKLFTKNYISEKLKNNKNEKIIYLPTSPYIINDTVFIGVCGWWDYDNEDTISIQKNMNYFDKWIHHLTEKDSLTFINNVINTSNNEFYYLKTEIQKYEKDNTINKIVIVTHTLPLLKYVSKEDVSAYRILYKI